MIYSRIAGTGSYLPKKILSNAELEKMVDTTDEWIFSRTGIRERHIVAEDEFTSDLALHAARQAIASANIDAHSIDLIIVATTTPDKVFPSTAVMLQNKLGIAGCPAFDMQAVCSGFVYALSTADNFIKSGAAKCALVVGAEAFSRIVDWTDRGNCILWGDGAGAVVLQASEEQGIISTHLHADGNYEKMLHVPRNMHGADTVVILCTHRELERSAGQCVEVRLGRSQLDARCLVGGHLKEVARAGEFEAMVTLGPRETVAARGRGGLGKGERAAVGADF